MKDESASMRDTTMSSVNVEVIPICLDLQLPGSHARVSPILLEGNNGNIYGTESIAIDIDWGSHFCHDLLVGELGFDPSLNKQ